MVYRVLRFLEYEFDSVESADGHMKHFEVPAVGAKRFSNACTIRSTIIQYPDDALPGHEHRASCHGPIGELQCGYE